MADCHSHSRGDERGEEAPLPGGLEPKVVEVYQGVGKVMSRYTAGKVGANFRGRGRGRALVPATTCTLHARARC